MFVPVVALRVREALRACDADVARVDCWTALRDIGVAVRATCVGVAVRVRDDVRVRVVDSAVVFIMRGWTTFCALRPATDVVLLPLRLAFCTIFPVRDCSVASLVVLSRTLVFDFVVFVVREAVVWWCDCVFFLSAVVVCLRVADCVWVVVRRVAARAVSGPSSATAA